MNFKVTTLCENHIGHGSKNLIGEHGLAFYIETENRHILFDTGQNLALANEFKYRVFLNTVGNVMEF